MRYILFVLVAACVVGCSPQKGVPASQFNQYSGKRFPTNDTVDVVELGVDLYPNSATPKGLPPMVRTSVQGIASVECWRETADQPKPVGDFYLSHLSESTVFASKIGVTVEGRNTRGDTVRVLATRKPGEKFTAIVISVIRKPVEP